MTDHRSLVDSTWLSEHLNDPDVIVLDATVFSTPRPEGGVTWIEGRAGFESEHITGARFADVLGAFSAPSESGDVLVFTLPDRDRFEQAARNLGIGPQSRVVVYDTATTAFAARMWWLFRSFGHESVSVLDGGLQAWKAGGGPTETGAAAQPTPGTFRAERRDGYFVDREEVLAVVHGTAPGTLVCALPPENPDVDRGFRGRPGRIPGSLTISAASLRDPGTGTLSLQGHFDVLDNRAARVIVYCGGGIAASLNAFALTLLGHEDVRVYDGSLNEWVLDDSAPMASTTTIS